jgi:ABC-type bacteriocin/lantibiotic exporter with double-glycine peptidase domain
MEQLKRIAAARLGIALFIAAFIFASVILAVAAVLALILWGWLMWRTRHLRRAMERAARQGEGVVIEGEYRVEREDRQVRDGRPRDPRG